jgi:hypothetical protein
MKFDITTGAQETIISFTAIVALAFLGYQTPIAENMALTQAGIIAIVG